MSQALGYAAHHSFTSLKPLAFERGEPAANEVEITVLFCGVCHSDVHQVKNEWGNTVYPCMPGHEIVGRVTKAGANATRHAVGDLVGVGCMVDSCRECEACKSGEENYCEGPNSWLATYNGPMMPASQADTGTNMYGRDNTYGGYSSHIVVPEDFVLKIPAGLAPEKAAPILCAGVTTYSPLKHWGIKAGDKVGIIGFGGLGDMAVTLARAMGEDGKTRRGRQARRGWRARKRQGHAQRLEAVLRLPARHDPAEARHRPVREPAQARQNHRHRRRAGADEARQQPDPRHAPHERRGLDHRRHKGNAGGA